MIMLTTINDAYLEQSLMLLDHFDPFVRVCYRFDTFTPTSILFFGCRTFDWSFYLTPGQHQRWMKNMSRIFVHLIFLKSTTRYKNILLSFFYRLTYSPYSLYVFCKPLCFPCAPFTHLPSYFYCYFPLLHCIIT